MCVGIWMLLLALHTQGKPYEQTYAGNYLLRHLSSPPVRVRVRAAPRFALTEARLTRERVERC